MLNNLVRLKKKRKIIGRGGDRGGTCGKGTKGQKARSGGRVKAQFEGGQTPLTRRLPKRGFNNSKFKNKFTIISFDDLESILSKTNSKIINKQLLLEHGVINNLKEQIKLLSNGNLTSTIDIELNSFSKSAIKKIELMGGKFNIAIQ